MSIASEIERLQNAKASIKTAIENKGVEVGDGTLDTYASKIDEISGGGSSKYAPRSISFYSYKGADLDYELANLDIQNLTSMAYMFTGCSNITNIDLSGWDTKNITDMKNMFESCGNLKSLNLSNCNTSKVTSLYYFLRHCSSLESLNIDGFDTSKVTNMGSAFQNCSKLTTIPELDASSCNNPFSMFLGCSALVNLGGLKNIGKAYSKTNSANYYSYKIDLSNCNKLTHESLMNVINNLYDIASLGVKTQDLVLGSTNLAKLTAEEIAIATNKGWVVS